MIAITALLKLLLASLLELGNDEVYYTGYARQLQLNYFDHPPLVAFILKIFSFNLQLKSEVFLSLGFVICGALSTYVIYLIAARLRDSYTGWIAVLLFTASPYACIISGMMIMPDAPLLLFWLLAVLQAIGIAQKEHVGRSLLLFGLFAGLALLSKVSAAMLWIGLSLYIVLMDRTLLRNRCLYWALGISFLLASPLVWWDTSNTIAGRSYHAERVAIDLSKVNITFFLRQLLGEIGYNNPICYVFTWIGMVYIVRRKCIASKSLAVLLLFSLPLIVMVNGLALFRETLPHWTGPSFSILIIIAAMYLANRYQAASSSVKPKSPRVVYWANVLLITGVSSIVWGTRYAPPFAAADNDPLKPGRGDLLLDMTGWKPFEADFMAMYQKDKEHKVMKPGAFIIAGKWFPGAHLDWYIAQPHTINLMVAGCVNDLHQYAVLNTRIPEIRMGSDAYFITCSNYYTPPDSTLLQCFNQSETEVLIPQIRSGKTVRHFVITRLHGYKGGISRNGIIKKLTPACCCKSYPK